MKRGTATVYVVRGWWLVDPEDGREVCEYVPQWWGREKGTIGMSIVESAKRELERINFGAEDTAAMVEILQRFFKQWDSGGAVACDIDAADPFAPITFPYDPTTRAPQMPVIEVEPNAFELGKAARDAGIVR